jgi:hypothetical protein
MRVLVEPDPRRVVAHRMPAAFQPTIAIKPMTSQRRGWNPALTLRAAKTRKVVIGIGAIGKPDFVHARHSVPRPNKPELCESRFCESCEHRSPPLPLLRGRPVSGRSAKHDHHPHAAKSRLKARAIDFDVLRQRGSDRRDRIGDAIGSTAHVLFVGVERPVSNAMSATMVGHYASPKPLSSAISYPPGGIAVILNGG